MIDTLDNVYIYMYMYMYMIHIDHLGIRMGHKKSINAKWQSRVAMSREQIWRMPLGDMKQNPKRNL